MVIEGPAPTLGAASTTICAKVRCGLALLAPENLSKRRSSFHIRSSDLMPIETCHAVRSGNLFIH